jgi:hypothetical protein
MGHLVIPGGGGRVTTCSAFLTIHRVPMCLACGREEPGTSMRNASPPGTGRSPIRS